MRPNPHPAVAILLALAVSGTAQASPEDNAARQPRFAAELAAGPLLGLERPIKGGSGGIAFGAGLGPFEAGLRAGAAYDAALAAGLVRIDLELGLGSGLRAIVGGLLPLGELALADPSASGETRVPVEAAPWPNRFGFAVAILDLPRPLLGARAFLDAELVYTDYRAAPTAPAAALVGAAAFAACVEATIALRLRWEFAPAHR